MANPQYKIVAGGTEKDDATGGPATEKVEIRVRGLKLAKEKASEFAITHRSATVYDDNDNYILEIENEKWGTPGNPPPVEPKERKDGHTEEY
jgi:hypothetical protein